MMDVTAILDLLLHGNQLKRTARTGWSRRGISHPESVAAHSHGVAFIVLVLAEIVEPRVDMSRALSMAVLHDLPESLTSDIPSPAWRLLPAGLKVDVERRSMSTILGRLPGAPRLMKLWEELAENHSVESRLVHDADKLDMYLQALMYQEQTGNRQLAEFWHRPHDFHFAESQAIYEQLRARREAL